MVADREQVVPQASVENAGVFALVRRDLERYFQLDGRDGARSLFEKLRVILDTPGLQSVLVYRFGSWTYRTIRFPLLRYPLTTLYYSLNKLCIACWGVDISPGAQIGPGLCIGHHNGIFIGPTKIGRDCNIAHHVTIGSRPPGLPVLGDRVWIGAGSVIFGSLKIGDGATVGPLTVISQNVPPRVVVLGNPPRLVQTDHDNSAQIYGTENVPVAAVHGRETG